MDDPMSRYEHGQYTGGDCMCMEDVPKDLSPATSEDMHMVRADVHENGIPPTPARWQRAFKWSYCKGSDALERIRKELNLEAEEINYHEPVK